MSWEFPQERADKRKVLLGAVDSVRDILAACADEAEAKATLPQAAVDALYDSGLLALKLPAELGGAEADPVTQLEVIEALTYIDTSAGWCTMIGATAVGLPAAFLPEDGFQKVFPNGYVPKMATVVMPGGTAEPVEGGYVISGRWPFGSGVRHSEWIDAGFRAPSDDEDSGWKPLKAAFRTSDATIHDNWQVMGLRGTGSCDFSVSNLFVPHEFVWDVYNDMPRRGGPIYLLGRPGFLANEHAAFALGVARRALDEIIGKASTTERGSVKVSSLASRPAFQRAVAQCDLKLRAVRLLVMEVFEEAWQCVSEGRKPEGRLQAEMRSSAVYATDVALDVVTEAFRYAGGSAIYESSVLQRCLRDINAAAQHLMVSNTSYENHGQFALGLPDANPLG